MVSPFRVSGARLECIVLDGAVVINDVLIETYRMLLLDSGEEMSQKSKESCLVYLVNSEVLEL